MSNNKNLIENKVYKDKSKNTEVQLINMSRSTNIDKAIDKKLKILKICFVGISAFMNQDHSTIVNELYFNSRYNIIESSNVKMTDILSLTDKTMKRYRCKYCSVAEAVLPLLDGEDI